MAMQLWQLVDMLKDMDASQLTAPVLTARLAGTRFDDASLQPYLSWKKGSYTRNGVWRTSEFEVILMAWDAGASSPVHAHSFQTCFLAVHTGHLAIESYRYAQAGDRGRVGSGVAVVLHDTTTLGPRDIEREIAGLDVHRVHNAGAAGERAVSLHVYARPFDRCITYDVTRHCAAWHDLTYHQIGPPPRRP